MLFALVVLGAVAVVAVLMPAGEDYYQQAKENLNRGEYSAALVHLKNEVRVRPANAEARWDLARMYLLLGDGASAEKELLAAQRHGAPSDQVALHLVEAYRLQNKHVELLADFDPAKFEGATRAQIEMARGLSLLALGRPDEAEAAVRSSLALDPKIASAHYALSEVLHSKGDVSGAEASIDMALELEPNEIRSLVKKGELRAFQGDLGTATSLFTRVIDILPEDREARVRRALAYIDQGKADAAWGDVNYLLELAPEHPFANYLKATLLANDGQYEDALAAVEPMEDALSSYPPVYNLLATLNIAMGRLEKALQYARRYLTQFPDSYLGNRQLGLIYLRMGDWQQAVAVLEPLLDRGGQDVLLLRMLGAANATGRRFREGASYFERAVALAPDDTDLKVRLATVRLSAGEVEEAISELEAILERDPQTVRAGTILVTTRLHMGDYEAAMAAAESMRDHAPDDPYTHFILGLVHQARQDNPAARRSYAESLALKSDFVPASLRLAQIASAEGDLEAAKTLLHGVLERDPRNVDAMTLLSDIAFAMADEEGGVHWLERAVSVGASTVEPRLRLTDIYLESGKADKALLTARAAAHGAPEDARVLDALARSQLAARQSANAVNTYRQIVELEPRIPIVRHRLAVALEEAGNNRAARKVLADAIALDPDFLPARLELAELDRLDGRLDAAEVRYTEILEQHPTNMAAMWGMARVAFSRGDRTTEIGWLREAAAANPEDVAPGRMLVAALIEVGWLDQALEEARALAGKAPENADALSAYGHAQLASGDAAGAVETFRKLTDHEPKWAKGYFDLGQALLALKDDESAAAALDKAIELDSDMAAARRLRLRAEANLGGGQAAVELAKRMAADVDSRSIGKILFAEMLEREGRHAEAADAYSVAFELNPTRQIAMRLAGAFAAAGDPERARRTLRRWVDGHPDDMTVRLALARQMYANGDISESIRESEQLLQRQPDSVMLINLLAAMYDMTGHPKALEFAEKARQLAPDSPRVAGTLGWILFKRGRREEALELLLRAHGGLPGDREVAYHLAVALSQMGRPEQARGLLAELLDDDSPFAEREAAERLAARLAAN